MADVCNMNERGNNKKLKLSGYTLWNGERERERENSR